MRPAHVVAYAALRLLGTALDGAFGTLLLVRHGQILDDFSCQFRVGSLLIFDVVLTAHVVIPSSLRLYLGGYWCRVGDLR